MPTEDSQTTPLSQPAALMRAAQAIVDRRRQMAASTGTPSPGWSIRPPPADPGPQTPPKQAPRAPEQGAQSFLGAQAQPGQLLGSIDTVTVPKADGSGHEVRHLDTGKLIAEGRDATEANAGAQDVARKLGRRRLLSWLLPDGSTPPTWTQNPKIFSLYDGAMRQGSAWQTAYHNREAIDPGAALPRYKALQDQISAAIISPDTPDEARLPLATAGEQLFSAANATGFVDADKLPPSMLYAGTGAMTLGGGDSATTQPIAPLRNSTALPQSLKARGLYQSSASLEPEQRGPRNLQGLLEDSISDQASAPPTPQAIFSESSRLPGDRSPKPAQEKPEALESNEAGYAKRRRQMYLGGTPDKYSATGRKVVERMRGEGRIQGDGPLTRGNPNNLQLVGSDGNLYAIDHTIDMAHKVDAVTWWNDVGRFSGAKSSKVRGFMLHPDNYQLDLQSSNRSAGARLGRTQTYLPPASDAEEK